MNIDAQDKYGKTAPQHWADARRPFPGLMRLADSLGPRPPLDIFKPVEQSRLAQVRKLLASGVDVNASSPMGSQQTLLHTADDDLSIAKLLVAKGADLRALDRELETTPAHWAWAALKYFNRKPCEAVAEYLEGLMYV